MEPTQEKLKKIDEAAEKTYGRPYSELSDAEKEAIATAFGTRRDTLDAQFLAAYQSIPTERRGVIQAGNVAAADTGGSIGDALRSIAGAAVMRKKSREMDDLSAKEEMARRAAGDVAAYNRQEELRILADALRGGGNAAGGNVQAPPVRSQPTTQAMPSTMVGGGPQPTPTTPQPPMSQPPSFAVPVGQPGGPQQPNVGGRPATPIPGNPDEFANYFSSMMGLPQRGQATREEDERRRRLAQALRMGTSIYPSL